MPAPKIMDWPSVSSPPVFLSFFGETVGAKTTKQPHTVDRRKTSLYGPSSVPFLRGHVALGVCVLAVICSVSDE